MCKKDEDTYLEISVHVSRAVRCGIEPLREQVRRYIVSQRFGRVLRLVVETGGGGKQSGYANPCIDIFLS